MKRALLYQVAGTRPLTAERAARADQMERTARLTAQSSHAEIVETARSWRAGGSIADVVDKLYDFDFDCQLLIVQVIAPLNTGADREYSFKDPSNGIDRRFLTDLIGEVRASQAEEARAIS